MANQNAGWAGTGIVGAAIVGMLAGRSSPPPQVTAPPAQQTPPAAASARPPSVADTTRLLTGDRLVREFLGDTAPPHSALARRGRLQRHRYSLDVLIATVPDPVDSRMDWAFDAYLASIRRAYERNGFVIDRFWMPWGSVADTLRVPDGPRVREAYPGAFLFRRQLTVDSVALSLVYLVGEVPTRGVHRPALVRALDERKRLLRAFAPAAAPSPRTAAVGDTAQRASPPGDTVKIVGPSFSGSSLSLRAVLDGWSGTDSADVPIVSIVSGSATNCENRAILRDTFPTADSRGRVRIEFRATVHSDEALLQALERRVFQPLHIPADQVVILQESSTGYGQNAFDGADSTRFVSSIPCGAAPSDAVKARRSKYIVVPFPMNVSRLRSEYARRPQPAPSSGTASAPAGAPHVPVDLADPARQLETPPVLSSLTVPSLETAVREIAAALTRRRVQAVIILGSDVRDRMFLGAELRRRVRDVQVFTFESNALFLAPDRNNDLRGMVVASTYPLFLRNQWWTAAENDRERLVFSSDGAQGVYNAVLLQMGADSLLSEFVPPDPGSATPENRPPVWITAVGAGAFVPIVVDTPQADVHYLQAASVTGPARVDDARISFFIRLSAVVLSLLLLELVRRAGMDVFRAREQRSRQAERARQAAQGARMRRDAEGREAGETPEALRAWRTSEASPAPEAGRTRERRRRSPQVAQAVRCASLRIHHYLYRLLGLIALTSVWMPVARIFTRAAAESRWASFYDTLHWLLLVLVAVAVAAETLLVVDQFAEHWEDGRDFAVGPHWQRLGRQVAWFVEVVARTGVVLLGVYFLLQSAAYVVEISRIGGPALRLYLHRVARVDAGVTPLLPLLLGAAGLGLWCTWHLRRVDRLRDVTMFEAACLCRWDGRANLVIQRWRARVEKIMEDEDVGWWRAAVLNRRVRREALERLRRVRGIQGRLRTTPAVEMVTTPRLLQGDTVKHVAEVRNRLFLMVPNPGGLVLLGILLALSLLLLLRIRHTLEHAAGTPSFDRLLRFAIVGALAATLWAVYRLVAIWRALRRVLEDVSTTPLLTAFDRLPREASRLTRLTLVGAPACEIVTSVRAAQWHQLHAIASRLPDPPPDDQRGVRVEKEADEDVLWAQIRGLEQGIQAGRARCDAFAGEGTLFQRLDAVLSTLWWSEPSTQQVASVSGAVREMSLWKDETRPDTGIMFRRSVPGPLRLWVRAAEEFAAVQVVDYVEWVLQHMRTLTWFLFLSLLLATTLLSSYPYEPQRLAKLALAVVLVFTVGTLVYVMTDMNRDEVLSRIAKTDPGRITWDGGYLLNVGVIAVVPVLTLISSEVPELREFLFSWLDPLLRVLAR